MIQANEPTNTRRSLIASSALAAACATLTPSPTLAAVPPQADEAAQAETEVMRLFSIREELRHRVMRNDDGRGWNDPVGPLVNDIIAIERHIALTPSESAADMAAKMLIGCNDGDDWPNGLEDPMLLEAQRLTGHKRLPDLDDDAECPDRYDTRRRS